ncbi:CgeB family protein [Acinetobacter equi]|uniref:Spore protein YkvP/CgeB glycosyl transferase-like domain-containing protein n=1 Tax=Acinetobacter equi TaxID=1324350 RepID=A0A0N9VZG2_9GAMM|nr:glycosyltransferase [Acinetobacter equi]ALH94686.1 hypothetical protein AOY20_03585 [Acinetobacter equi]
MKNLRILSILDDFTYQNLKLEPYVELLTNRPFLYSKYNKIDLLLVESAWLGNQSKWRHKVASYPNHPKRNINDLKKLVLWCKNHNIPTVFWNKEDPYHYDQFIEAAQLFDYIFTTDELSLSQYAIDAPHSKATTLTFFIQPQLHFRKNNITPIKRTLFTGTYQKNRLDHRTLWQNKIFEAAAPYGLDLYNRHINKSDYEFPELSGDVHYFNPISYSKIVDIYRSYQQILNVNTIVQSPTMFSRRLIEVMACGRLVISNPSLSIQNLFPEMCLEITADDEASTLFEQLQYGYSIQQKNMINYAYEHVHQHYTAKEWLKKLLKYCNIDHAYLSL